MLCPKQNTYVSEVQSHLGYQLPLLDRGILHIIFFGAVQY